MKKKKLAKVKNINTKAEKGNKFTVLINENDKHIAVLMNLVAKGLDYDVYIKEHKSEVNLNHLVVNLIASKIRMKKFMTEYGEALDYDSILMYLVEYQIRSGNFINQYFKKFDLNRVLVNLIAYKIPYDNFVKVFKRYIDFNEVFAALKRNNIKIDSDLKDYLNEVRISVANEKTRKKKTKSILNLGKKLLPAKIKKIISTLKEAKK